MLVADLTGGPSAGPELRTARSAWRLERLAVWVPYEQAEARIAAALAAGGRMVRDEFAPYWWTLADAAGNEADIATTKGRD